MDVVRMLEDANGTRRRLLFGLLLLKNDVHLFFIRANKESRTRNFASFIKSAARLGREKCAKAFSVVATTVDWTGSGWAGLR